MNAGRTPSCSAERANSGLSAVRRIAPSSAAIVAGGVPRGTAMPRQNSSDASTPCSFAVATSGSAGSRLGVIAAIRRTLPDLTCAASAPGSCTSTSTCPPSRFGTVCAAA